MPAACPGPANPRPARYPQFPRNPGVPAGSLGDRSLSSSSPWLSPRPILPMRPIRLPALALATVTLCSADVLVVDEAGFGDFLDLQPAIDSASDGDVLLVKSGVYSAPVLDDRSLTIVADSGVTAFVQGTTRVNNGTENDTVLFSGLTFEGPAGDSAVSVAFCLGAVRLQDCEVRGLDASECQTNAAGDGLDVEQCADVALTGCSVSGGEGRAGCTTDASGFAGRAAVSRSSVLTVYRSILRGGDGGNVFFFQGGSGGSGLVLSDQGSCRLVQCQVVGGDSGDGELCSNGAPGLVVGSGTEAVELGCTFQGGDGSTGAFGLTCRDGDAYTGDLLHLPGSPRAILVDRVVRAGDSATLQFFGQPGDVVRLFYSDSTQQSLRLSASGVLLLGGLPITTVEPNGTVPGVGSFASPLPAPPLPPGEGAAVVYLQAQFLGTQGVVLSNLAAVVRLDPGLSPLK